MLQYPHFMRTLLLIAISSTLLACTENGVSMFIRHVPKPNPTDSCIVEKDPAGDAYLFGLMDKAFPGGQSYVRAVLAGNQLQPRGDADTLKPETSQIQIYEAEVIVFDVQGNELLSYTHPTSGFIDEASGIDPSYGVSSVTMVPPEVSAVFDTSTGVGYQLVSRVRLFGTTLGGTEVQSGTWDWPVFLCETTPDFGCIGGYPPEDAESPIVPNCPDGQDDKVDVRVLADILSNHPGCQGKNKPPSCP